MASPVLFSTGASSSQGQTMRNLIEFKAGKLEMRDNKMVHPIKRQGMVYLHQSQDDNLMHFCWKDRQTGVVEDDLILFPDDCEYKRVKECTTGRVYVLKMKSSNRKMFFWMQESRSDRDEEYCKKINDMLNNPPRAGNDMGGGSSDRDLQALFGNMTQEQVAQLLSSNGVNLASLLNSAAGQSPSSASSTASTTNSAPNSANAPTSANIDPSNINDFRSLISGAFMEDNEEAASSQPQQQQTPLIDLSTAINSESLAHLLNDEEFLNQIKPHLPPIESSDDTKKQFGDTIRSSQFRSSLSQFCVALQSGQLGPLMSQFGLNQACVDAANLGNLEAFVRALDAQTSSSTGSGAPPSEPKDKN